MSGRSVDLPPLRIALLSDIFLMIRSCEGSILAWLLLIDVDNLLRMNFSKATQTKVTQSYHVDNMQQHESAVYCKQTQNLQYVPSTRNKRGYHGVNNVHFSGGTYRVFATVHKGSEHRLRKYSPDLQANTRHSDEQGNSISSTTNRRKRRHAGS